MPDQKLFAGAIFSAATPLAYASGNPVVFYLMISKIVVLLCVGLWVVVIKKAWRLKFQAFVFVISGLLAIFALSGIPNYIDYQVWIEGASIFILVLAFASVSYVLRHR